MGGMVGRALGVVKRGLDAIGVWLVRVAIYVIAALIVTWDFVFQGWDAE